MVPNGLQWRLIDLCVKQIDRRLLFSVHRGLWWRQAALIKWTVHHDCFYWRNKDYNEYRDWKKYAFTIRAWEGKRSDICCDMFPICSHLCCMVLETFVRHFHFALLRSSFCIPFPTLSPLLSSLIGWTAKIDQQFLKVMERSKRSVVKRWGNERVERKGKQQRQQIKSRFTALTNLCSVIGSMLHFLQH